MYYSQTQIIQERQCTCNQMYHNLIPSTARCTVCLVTFSLFCTSSEARASLCTPLEVIGTMLVAWVSYPTKYIYPLTAARFFAPCSPPGRTIASNGAFVTAACRLVSGHTTTLRLHFTGSVPDSPAIVTAIWKSKFLSQGQSGTGGRFFFE